MKLSEALIQRADIQKRLSGIQQRLAQSALIQEGSRAPEDPKKLLQEMDRLLGELEQFVKRINRTNSTITLTEGKTLTEALAERDTMKMEYGILTTLVKAAVPQQNRYSRSEVKFLPTVNVADIQQRLDDLARRYRELDTQIQALNWEADLIE
jgi:hypothetical protein